MVAFGRCCSIVVGDCILFLAKPITPLARYRCTILMAPGPILLGSSWHMTIIISIIMWHPFQT